MYVLTGKGEIHSPVILGVDANVDHSFDLTCTDGEVISINVYADPIIPQGYESQLQAVPLDLFNQVTRGLICQN